MKKPAEEIETFSTKRAGTPAPHPTIQQCALVNQFNLVCAKFGIAPELAKSLRFVEFDGRVFEKRYEHGGGYLTFYELLPFHLSKLDTLI